MKALIVSFLLLFINTCLFAQNKRVNVQPVPEWVSKININYADTCLDKDAEDGYSDLDYEEQVSLDEQTTFYRKTIRIITASGVENASEVSVTFDPSYNQLIFHDLVIIRKGQRINKLAPNDFKIVQQETELSRHIYNGSVTAVLFLKDVRKDDIIEYSYSLKGFNPIFQKKYDRAFYFNSATLSYNVLYKIIVPSGRGIQTKINGENITPEVLNTKYGTSYQWSRHYVPAVKVQDHTPSWYNPYNSLMISEYENWASVVAWAKELFNSNVSIAPELNNEIHKISTAHATPEKKVLATLQFVQDDIRYMGVEMGENSHKPHDPNQVYKQRFGDCKDKSYLLCTMLRAMGVEASPVLISTIEKKSLLEILPGVRAFDHVTVRVKLNGKNYWFDPTISYQRGSLDDISYPNYQYGLVIEDGAKELARIALQDQGRVLVKEIFDILNTTGDAKLSVTTEFSGSFADEVRYSYAGNSNGSIQSNYKKFYGAYYDNIEADSISHTDDASTGKFTVKEYYTLKDIWKITDAKKAIDFNSYVINSVLRKPKDVNRTMPFELSYPCKYIEDIEINLPEDWDVSEYSDHTSNAAFSMKASFTYADKKIKLHYEYENFKDHVLPAEAKDYMVSYGMIDSNMGFSVTYGGKADTKVSTVAVSMQQPSFVMVFLYIFIAILLLAILIVLATKLK